MNKQQLINELADMTGTYKAVAERFINALTELIITELANGEKVQILGFGTFETRDRSERNVRSPKDGTILHIDACTVPVFKAGRAFKEAVNK